MQRQRKNETSAIRKMTQIVDATDVYTSLLVAKTISWEKLANWAA